MKTTDIKRTWKVAGLAALGLVLAPAAAEAQFTGSNENDRFGEVRLSRLHPGAEVEGEGGAAALRDRAQVSKVPWVGNWWSYARNGLADCWDARGFGQPAERCFSDPDYLSPVEKLDAWLGRTDQIDREGLTDYVDGVAGMSALAVERRNLIPRLNRWIGENPGQDWRTTEDGERYLELTDELDTLKADLPDVHVNTATEFEVIHHGQGVLGYDSWWGHCNAWAAAAIMEPEPRYNTEVDGIEFTIADVKAYLTENWMEHRSSFIGSRANSDPESGEDWADLPVAYKDMTPAQFHIYTADQIGLKDKSFVIDRYTGDQVWNHPMRAYRTRLEALYENEDTPERVEVFQTTYDFQGTGRERSLGERDVYRVLATTTIHWMDDGVPHMTLTAESVNEEDSDADFADAWRIRQRHQNQVHLRTLTYELWLSHPIGHPDAQIVGDGEWKHASMIGNHNHPDFAWQPQSQTPSMRDYENPHVPYQKVVAELLPGTLAPPVSPDPEPDPDDEPRIGPSDLVFEITGLDIAIPDNDETGIRVTVDVDIDVEITSVTLIPNISHTYTADLEITLRKGRRWNIVKRTGEGGSGDYEVRPYDVPHYIGDTTAGTWTLVIKDKWAMDVGTLHGWTLIFNQ
jgi:hypothetical protein